MSSTVHNIIKFCLLLSGVLADTASGVWFNTDSSKTCPENTCTSSNISSAAFLKCCNEEAAASCDNYVCPSQTHYKKTGNHSCVGTMCQLESIVDLNQCCDAYPTCKNSVTVNQSTCNDYFGHENISFVSDAICPESGCSNKICCSNNNDTNTNMDTCHDVCNDLSKKLISPVPVCDGASCNATTCCVDDVKCSDQIRCEVDETLDVLKNCTENSCTHDECCSKTPVLCYKAHEKNMSHVCDTGNHFYVKSTTATYDVHHSDSFDKQCCENITASSLTACGLSSNQTCADLSKMYSSHFSYDNSTAAVDAAPASCCIPKPTCKDDFDQTQCKMTASPTLSATITPTVSPSPEPTTGSPTLQVFDNQYQPVYPETKVERDWVDSSYIDRIFTVTIKGNFESLKNRIDNASRRRLTETKTSVWIAIAKAIYKKEGVLSVKINDVTNAHIKFEVIAMDNTDKDKLEQKYKDTINIAGTSYAVTSVEATANTDLYQHHLDFSWQILVPYNKKHENCSAIVESLKKEDVIMAIEDTFNSFHILLNEVKITHLSCTDTSHIHCACEALHDEEELKKCKKDDNFASLHYTAKASIHSQYKNLAQALEKVHNNKELIHDEVIAQLNLSHHNEVFTQNNINDILVAEVDESCFDQGFSTGEIVGIVLGALILAILLGYGIYYLITTVQGNSPYVPFTAASSVSSSLMVYEL